MLKCGHPYLLILRMLLLEAVCVLALCGFSVRLSLSMVVGSHSVAGLPRVIQVLQRGAKGNRENRESAQAIFVCDSAENGIVMPATAQIAVGKASQKGKMMQQVGGSVWFHQQRSVFDPAASRLCDIHPGQEAIMCPRARGHT